MFVSGTYRQGSPLCWHSSLISSSALMTALITHHTIMMLRAQRMS